MSETETPPDESENDSDSEQRAKLIDDVELRELESVMPYGNNAKEHPDEQVEKIASSISNYGWDQPIVVDGDGEIIKGHGRYRAAKRLGLSKVPVIERTDLTDAQIKASRLADNRVAESDWDDELLASELDLLQEEQFDLELTGFDHDEIDDYLELMSPPEMLDEDVDEDDDEYQEGLNVVILVEDEADAEFVGTWADEQNLEWHVVDQ